MGVKPGSLHPLRIDHPDTAGGKGKILMPSNGQRHELDALCIWQRANEGGLHEKREVTRPTPAHRANADERDEMLSAP